MTQSTAIQTSCCNMIPGPAQSATQHQRGPDAWSYLPQIDVLEQSGEYTIECDAPGVEASELNLTIENGHLIVNGAVPPRYSEGARFLVQEYGVGDFHRDIPLGKLSELVDAERVSAEYKNGVLTIHLPKLAAAQARKIQITS